MGIRRGGADALRDEHARGVRAEGVAAQLLWFEGQ